MRIFLMGLDFQGSFSVNDFNTSMLRVCAQRVSGFSLLSGGGGGGLTTFI